MAGDSRGKGTNVVETAIVTNEIKCCAAFRGFASGLPRFLAVEALRANWRKRNRFSFRCVVLLA